MNVKPEPAALLDLPTDKFSLFVENVKVRLGVLSLQSLGQCFPLLQFSVEPPQWLPGLPITKRTRNLGSYPPLPQNNRIQ